MGKHGVNEWEEGRRRWEGGDGGGGGKREEYKGRRSLIHEKGWRMEEGAITCQGVVGRAEGREGVD